MKNSVTLTELDISSIAADAKIQGTTGAGGRCNQRSIDRPCHVSKSSSQTDEAYRLLFEPISSVIKEVILDG